MEDSRRLCVKFLVYSAEADHGDYHSQTDVYKTGQVLGVSACVNPWAASGKRSVRTSDVWVDEENKAACEQKWCKGESVHLWEG